MRGRRFYLSVDGSGRKIARGSGRREEAVEVERQAVELLVPAVPLERPEPRPPRQAPVVGRALGLQRVVQEHGHDQPHRRRRREDGVDVVVELHASIPPRPYKKEKKLVTIFSVQSEFSIMPGSNC